MLGVLTEPNMSLSALGYPTSHIQTAYKTPGGTAAIQLFSTILLMCEFNPTKNILFSSVVLVRTELVSNELFPLKWEPQQHTTALL